MDARIGAASGDDGVGRGFQMAEGGFDGALHRRLTAGLPLPAVERGAVIFDEEGVSGHGVTG